LAPVLDVVGLEVLRVRKLELAYLLGLLVPYKKHDDREVLLESI
jgi:hypothetical protein